MFRRDKGRTETPSVPPRPSREELDNPIAHSLSEGEMNAVLQEDNSDVKSVPRNKSTGVMGVMQKVNPFKSTSQVSPTVSKASSSESLEKGIASDSTQNPGRLKGVMQKVNPFKTTSQVSSTVSKAPSTESLEQGGRPQATQNPGMFKGVMQKVNPFKSSSQASPAVSKAPSSESLEQRNTPESTQVSSTVSKAPSTESLEQGGRPQSTQNPGMFKGVMQKVNPFKSSSQASPAVSKASSSESLEQRNTPESTQLQVPKEDSNDVSDLQGTEKQQQSPGMFMGMMQKVNPFRSTAKTQQDSQSLHSDLSSSAGSLDNNNLTEKQVTKGTTDTEDHQVTKQNPGMFQGFVQKVNPFKTTAQPEVQSIHSDQSSSSESLDESTIDRHTTWYTDTAVSSEVKSKPKLAEKKRTPTFRIRRILPGAFFGSGNKNSSESDIQPIVQEEIVEVQAVDLDDVPVPCDGTTADPMDDEDGLMAWWRTVEGWEEWNDTNKDEEAEEVVEEAADRVFMAARLFVRLFNRRGASMQKIILELLALADAADTFHKKTVTASVGGGVASVAGSITTITGLILAPFTMGTSLIVTAVGIAVATGGGIASASANITDTVHSKTDRKKVEKLIQGYQEQIKDISECLAFLQAGMDALAEWDFEAYAESINKKHLNQNVKHVVKEGGRAGKALLINAESLISTVQVLSVAGGAAKAAQVMSVTTGVMSGLFLALDVFFLAKDSIELKKGAKTDFAAKIREVCKDLQDGLLELNNIKEELQKTIDGIEVEVEEEEEEDEEMLKSDLKKLAQLEE